MTRDAIRHAKIVAAIVGVTDRGVAARNIPRGEKPWKRKRNTIADIRMENREKEELEEIV